MSVPAWAENAVIVSDDGRTVKYHVRCPYCGKVDTTTTRSISVIAGITNTPGSCTSTLCYKHFTVKLGRK